MTRGSDRLRWFGLTLYGIAAGLPEVARSLGPARLRLDDLVLLGLGAILVFTPPRVEGRMPLRPLLAATFFAYVLYCALSIMGAVLSGAPIEGYWIAVFVGGTLMYLVLFPLLRTERDLHALCCGLTLGGVLLALQLYMRVQDAGGIGMYALASTIYDVKHNLAFTSWNPNTIGAVSIVTVFASVTAGHLGGPGLRGRWPWMLMPLLLAIPALTLSRGAVAALAVGGVLVILLEARARPGRSVLAISGLGAVALAAFLVVGDSLALASRFNLMTGEGTARRSTFWPFSIEKWLERPLFGYGFGCERELFRAEFGRGSSHNSILNVLVETGLLGLVLLAIAAVVWLTAWERVRSSEGSSRFLLHLSLGLAAATFAIGMSHNAFPWQKTAVLAFALIAALPQVAALRTDPGTRL